MIDSSDTSVKVAVRIRPLNPDEHLQDNTICINTVPGAPQIVAGTDQFFTFDHVFGIDSSQAGIYDFCVSDLVNAAFEGFNATILAYGQTGSGKTFTMGSAAGYDVRMTPETVGIIPRVISNIFEIVREKEANDPNSTYKIFVQFLEIYGEDIKDLLDHTKTSKVAIRETATGEVFVSGAREEVVNSAAQMMKALEDGTRHRTTASTLMNQSSSRSHAIFTVFLEHTIHTGAVLDQLNSGGDDDGINSDKEKGDDDTENKDEESTSTPRPGAAVSVAQNKAEVRKCKFHFVDLAGSERAKRTGAQGQQLKEGIDINKGLLALGNVISALGDETKRGKVHVPYRDSKLTRMLQDSLGGNSKTLMICCVSPAGVNFYESLNALRYANRARNIKNKPIINRDPTMVIIDELRAVVRTLASELLDVRKSAIIAAPDNAITIEELERLVSAAPAAAGHSQSSSFSTRPAPSKLSVLPTAAASGLVSRVNRMQLTDDVGIVSPYSGGGAHGTGAGAAAHRRNMTTGGSNAASDAAATAALNASNATTIEAQSREILMLKGRSSEADFELKRLTEQLRLSRMQASELTDRVVLIQSERDFFKMKWSEASPEEANSLDRAASKSAYELLKAQAESEGRDPPPPEDTLLGGECSPEDEAVAAGKDRVTATIGGYLKEIDSLKKQLAEQDQMSKMRAEAADSFDDGDALLENELTSNVARVIAQTEHHLIQEARRLKSLVSDPSVIVGSDGAVDSVIAVALANAEDDDEGEGEDGGDVGGDGNNREAISQKETQIEVDTTAFQRRQKIMTREVSELGESIQLKEQLVQQLRRSHYQYGVMKTFYEQKLHALNEEMAAKEEEREGLLKELHELEQTKNEAEAIKQKLDRQARLRDELSKKDQELNTLKKRQQELNSLSQVQSKYQQQMVKLESEIETMKKSRVDLSKSIQTEKKKHLQVLTDKAREIETLKRALYKSVIEVKKMGKDKERAEERAKEAIREGVVLRKRANDLQRQGGASDTGRNARRAMGAANSNSARFLSEDELRVKRWLDRRIADINAREEAAESLRQQCEQQLALLNRKEALEAERSSLERSVRDLIVGGDSNEDRGGGFDTSESGGGSGAHKTLTREEEDAIREIEDRIDSVEGQLKLRNQNITEMESKLAIAQEASEDKTVETLKRTAAVSLPAAHELIRLLFDMLVSSRHLAQQRKSLLARSEAKERKLREELDEASAQITAVMHAHDMELTIAAHEYEEKLQGLLNHSTAGILGGSSSTGNGNEGGNSFSDSDFPMVDEIPYKKNDHHKSSSSSSFHSDSSFSSLAAEGPSSTAAASTTVESFKRAEEHYKMLLAVSTEQSIVLRSQLSFESGRSNELLSRSYELEHARMQLQKDLEEKDIHIKFLEDERRLFRDMADDLRTGLTTLGGAVGQTILKQVRERAAAKAERDNRHVTLSAFDSVVGGGGAGEQEQGDSEFGAGDDTESLLGEYNNLADVITRTGGVMERIPSSSSAAMRGGGGGAFSGNTATTVKGAVYDRLTNPSNFTGAMKSVFEEDLAKKRQKVQLIKSGQVKREIGFGYGPAAGSTMTGAAATGGAKSEKIDLRRRRNQNIADYLEGIGGGSGSATDDGTSSIVSPDYLGSSGGFSSSNVIPPPAVPHSSGRTNDDAWTTSFAGGAAGGGRTGQAGGSPPDHAPPSSSLSVSNMLANARKMSRLAAAGAATATSGGAGGLVVRLSLESDPGTTSAGGGAGSRSRPDSPAIAAVAPADSGRGYHRDEGTGRGDNRNSSSTNEVMLTIDPSPSTGVRRSSSSKRRSTYFLTEEDDEDDEPQEHSENILLESQQQNGGGQDISWRSDNSNPNDSSDLVSASSNPNNTSKDHRGGMRRSNSFSSFSGVGGSSDSRDDVGANMGEEKVRVSAQERRMMIVADRLLAATAQGGRRNVLGGVGGHVLKRGSNANMAPLSPTTSTAGDTKSSSPRVVRPTAASSATGTSNGYVGVLSGSSSLLLPSVGTLPGPSVPK